MGFFSHSPLPILSLSIGRSQLEVVVLAAGVVDDLDEVLPRVLSGLVVDLLGDIVVDRRSHGLVSS